MTRHEATTTKSARSVAVPSTIPDQTNRRSLSGLHRPVTQAPEAAVIYRRSDTSVTFRCKACYLQWTITRASLHRAASTFAAAFREAGVPADDGRVKQCDFIASWTKFAVDREAARKSTITRQKQRRVIRLPDRS
jgi:hypothetical protein